MAHNKNDTGDVFLPKYLLRDSAPFALQEAYKTLRTNLIYSIPKNNNGCICIGVTSASRAEGKSSSSLNLALSYAHIGKEVLLIDCDLRCPSINAKLHFMGAKGFPGMSELLIGNCTLKDSIQHLDEIRLDLLPSGKIPPDATTLFESDNMPLLFDTIKGHYDVIVVDLPPVLSVVDAAILSRYLDGFVLVVRHNHTRLDAVEAMIRQLRLADAKLLGFLYNDAPLESKKYSSYYYAKKT